MSITTTDLRGFGYRELDMAADLLKVYAENGADFLGDGISLNFNPNSGNVFLTDEDWRVGMLDDDGKLREWFSCPNCGAEGFDGYEAYSTYGEGERFEFEKYEGCCCRACWKKCNG